MEEMKKKHLWYYLVAGVIFAAGLALIFINKHDNNLQAMVIMMTATCYFVWSLLHHYVHHDLHPKVVVEYMLVASIGVVLSLFLFSV